MPDDLIGYEASSLTAVEAVLDGLDPATSKEVYLGTRNLDARAVAAVAASRADAGGSSFPPEWTVGAAGDLTIASSDATGDDILRIEAPAGYHQSSGDGYLLRAFAGDGTEILNFDPSGAMQIGPAAEEGTRATLTLSNDIATGEGATVLRSAGGSLPRIVAADINARAIFIVTQSGHIYTGANAAPGDIEIQAGQMVLWFDQTNGAAKLMVKAKSADGTVVTGQVALA